MVPLITVVLVYTCVYLCSEEKEHRERLREGRWKVKRKPVSKTSLSLILKHTHTHTHTLSE